MPQSFTSADLARVARLARLELGPEDADRLAGELARILDYAEQVQQVDTTGIAPTAHVLDAGAPLREDSPAPSLSRDDAVAGAPEADPAAGLFKVPRVLG